MPNEVASQEYHAAGGTPCAFPGTVYYKGTFGRGTDTGTHIGCTDSGGILSSRWHSNGFGTEGRFVVALTSDTAWNGSYKIDGDTTPYLWSGVFDAHFQGDGVETQCGRIGFNRAPQAELAVNEVRVVAVQPDVRVHCAGTPEDEWHVVKKDTVIQQGDEISCDPDGAATLQFADTATVVVKRTNQLKIASFFTEGGVVKTEILLKMGEVAAQVHKSEATKSDFRIRRPTDVSSVRGTEFSVSYDPVTRVGTTTVTEGVVEVQPVVFHDPYTDASVPRGAPFELPAGQEVQVSSAAVGAVAPIGQSIAPSGGQNVSPTALTKASAIAAVKQLLKQNKTACKLTTKWVKAKKTPKGYRVSARVLLAGVKGTAVWNLTGLSPKAFNKLATRIQAGCR